MHSSSSAKAAQRSAARSGSSDDDPSRHRVPILGSIDIPPPVFFCSIEPSSAAQQKGRMVERYSPELYTSTRT